VSQLLALPTNWRSEQTCFSVKTWQVHQNLIAEHLVVFILTSAMGHVLWGPGVRGCGHRRVALKMILLSPEGRFWLKGEAKRKKGKQ